MLSTPPNLHSVRVGCRWLWSYVSQCGFLNPCLSRVIHSEQCRPPGVPVGGSLLTPPKPKGWWKAVAIRVFICQPTSSLGLTHSLIIMQSCSWRRLEWAGICFCRAQFLQIINHQNSWFSLINEEEAWNLQSPRMSCCHCVRIDLLCSKLKSMPLLPLWIPYKLNFSITSCDS